MRLRALVAVLTLVGSLVLFSEVAAEQPGESRLARLDLDAQQSMARSTKQLVDLTRIQMLLGLVGAIGLGGSLFYAHKTAGHARRAVEVATDTAKRQLRAYVSVSEATPVGVAVGQRPLVRVVLKNTGQTPADDFVVVGGIMLHAVGTMPLFADSDIDKYPTLSVGSGCEHHINLALSEPLGDKFLQSIMEESYTISAKMEYKYTDIFGDCYRYNVMLKSVVRGGELLFTVSELG